YSMSDLYVMPSVSEPFGISPLEAMMHGVPVIVSRQSGVSEVIQNCIKVDFWNVEELAEQILRVLHDTELKQNMQQEGHREVQAISWDAPAEKMEQVYGRLVK
ncbi:MAG TPA: glycosyltransferase family 4 protein, partial [Leptospiraceae bacterium]|nr:glycosyltransferase family 4 protein [Leptospiraceae bacterium]